MFRKHWNRAVSILLSLAMALAMAVPSMATELTEIEGEAGHAYQSEPEPHNEQMEADALEEPDASHGAGAGVSEDEDIASPASGDSDFQQSDESSGENNGAESAALEADDGIAEGVASQFEAELTTLAAIMPMAAIGFPDDDKYDLLPAYHYDYNAPDLHNYKYFKIYESSPIKVLGEGAIGGGALYSAPMIPDGREIIFEFLNEQSQNIRLELWEDNGGEAGNYLGLISYGYAEGQWGILGGDQWHTHTDEKDEGPIINVANYLIWRGLYFDNALQRMIFPGENEDGSIEKGEFHYFVRFQPVDEDTFTYTVDVPLVINYTDAALARISQLRGENCNDGEPVNMTNGNFLWDYTDIAVFGAKPLEFARHYNSLDENDGELGFGWRHSFMYSIDRTQVYATLNLPDGNKVSFNIKGDGTFVGSVGEDYTLESHQGGYLAKDKQLNGYYFNLSGQLVAIEDVGGNRTEIVRNGAEILTVSNRAGTLAFSYSGGKIARIADQTGRSVQYAYDGNGDLASYTNADGDAFDYRYQNHQIVGISDFNGNTYLTIAYDSAGRVAELYLDGQGTAYFSYDFENRVSAIATPEGAVRKYYYNANAKVLAFEDVHGQTSYEYADGRIASITDRIGNATHYTYDAAGNTISITYPDGKAEYFEYNELNLPTRQIGRDGAQVIMEYDSNGNMTVQTDARGNQSLYAYDADGNMLSHTNENGDTATYAYDSKGNCLTYTDALGNVSRSEYDGQGRLVRQVYPDGGTAEYEYTDGGKLVKSIDAMGNEQTMVVTGNGYNEKLTDMLGNEMSYAYNTNNLPVSVTDPLGNITSYEYDGDGRLIRTTDALGNTTLYAYDNSGLITSMTDARGYTWHYSYDAEGRMTSSVDALGYANDTSYGSMGQILLNVNGRGAATSYAYDDAGRVTRITDAYDHSTRTVYDPNGNAIEEYDKNGNKWSYEYDAANRRISATDPVGFVTAYAYDANGQKTKTVTHLGTESRSEYDSKGRLVLIVDSEGNEIAYEYDLLDRLVKTTFADGTATFNEYDKNGWLASSTAEDGGITSYAYNNSGQVLAITDALGGVTSYEYDALGRTIKEVDALGGTTSYEYDENGNAARVVDALGGAICFSYDALNRVSAMTDAMGQSTAVEYDANGNITRIVNPDGGTILYEYDLLDRLISCTDAEGFSYTLSYDANGNITSATDSLGNKSAVRYDPLDRVILEVDAAGGESAYEYDADGRTVKKTSADGAETRYSYDQNGNVLKATDALGNETVFSYDSMDRMVSTTDALGAVTSYAYTPAGKSAAVTDALGGVYSYEYDLLGRLVSETNENGETSSYAYDALGRTLSKTNPLGHTDTFAYDAKGRITSVTDRNGNATRYVLDANGNIVETIDALGNSSYYEYDSMNRLVKISLHRVDAKDCVDEWQITLYQYDRRGLRTREINAAENETIYVYDGNGNLAQKTDADGYVTEYEYDPRNLVEAVNYSDGRSVSFAYTANGELAEMTDWLGTTTFEMDLLGRIVSVNDHNGQNTRYAYDAVGNRTGMAYPDGAEVEYEYDLLGRQSKVTDAEKQATVYAYDAADRLVKQVYPNNWIEYYEYDAAGQKTKVFDINPRGWLTKSSKSRYQYDANGNLVKEYSRGTGTGQATEEWSYKYDALNQIVQKDGLYSRLSTKFVYDSLGNLTHEFGSASSADYKNNALNQLAEKTVYFGFASTKTVYDYDSRGNLVKETNKLPYGWATIDKVVAGYVYDATNRMVLGANESGETSAYVYNGLGDRVGNVEVTLKDCYGYYGFNAAPAYGWFPWFSGWSPYGSGYGSYGGGYGYGGYGYGALGYGGYGYGGLGYYGCGSWSWWKPWEPGMPEPEDAPWPFEGIIQPLAYTTQTVEKSYVLDYASELRDVILEKENGGLAYRFTYGLEKLSAIISGPTYDYCNLFVNGAAKVWYHQDRLGSTDIITDNIWGNVVSTITYNEWGEALQANWLKLGKRQADLVAEYTGHPYDRVLGMYFAKARMYDAGDRRFAGMDPVDGYAARPYTFVQYQYVGNNPLRYTDPFGAFRSGDTLKNTLFFFTNDWDDVKTLRKALNAYSAQLGFEPLDENSGLFGAQTQAAVNAYKNTYLPECNLGSDEGVVDYRTWQALGLPFDMPEGIVDSYTELLFAWDSAKGIWYSPVDVLQRDFGYNDVYNFFFKLTDYLFFKSEFTYDGTGWMVEGWKGDYLNMGMGAEIGSYYDLPIVTDNFAAYFLAVGICALAQAEKYWSVTNADMPYLEYTLYDESDASKSKAIFKVGPQKHWWLNGFRPGIAKTEAKNLTVKGYICFSEFGKADGFVNGLKKPNVRPSVVDRFDNANFAAESPTRINNWYVSGNTVYQVNFTWRSSK